MDLLVGEAFPATEVPLAELWERGYVQPASLGGDLRGLLGPGEVARVDGLELFVGELSDKAPSLLTACLVERAVGVALQAPGQIPIRLAVAHEEDPSHAVRLATRWTSAFAIDCASSPARPAGSGSRLHAYWLRRTRVS